MLNQASRFGAVLDMVTDRVATTCLCIYLAMLFQPQHAIFFASLVVLDIFSHWAHMYAALYAKAESHKGSKHWLVRLYYSRTILFSACLGNESFFALLYLFGAGVRGPILATLSSPLPILAVSDVSLVVVLLVICFPVFLLKQTTNVVQMKVAFDDIIRTEQLLAKEERT